jgi:hypothetical protein
MSSPLNYLMGLVSSKFGLVVCKEYAAVLPEPNDTEAEVPAQRGADTADTTGPLCRKPPLCFTLIFDSLLQAGYICHPQHGRKPR